MLLIRDKKLDLFTGPLTDPDWYSGCFVLVLGVYGAVTAVIATVVLVLSNPTVVPIFTLVPLAVGILVSIPSWITLWGRTKAAELTLAENCDVGDGNESPSAEDRIVCRGHSVQLAALLASSPSERLTAKRYTTLLPLGIMYWAYVLSPIPVVIGIPPRSWIMAVPVCFVVFGWVAWILFLRTRFELRDGSLEVWPDGLLRKGRLPRRRVDLTSARIECSYPKSTVTVTPSGEPPCTLSLWGVSRRHAFVGSLFKHAGAERGDYVYIP